MNTNEFVFAFPVTTVCIDREATFTNWQGTFIYPSQKEYSVFVAGYNCTFKICEPEELNENEEPERVYIKITGIIEENASIAFEKAFELCECFLNFYVLKQIEQYLNPDLLDTQFLISKKDVICLKGKQNFKERISSNYGLNSEFKHFKESFSVIYNDHLLRSIVSSFRALCGPHDIQTKYYIAFMTLEQIEGRANIKNKSILTKTEKKRLSSKVDQMFLEFPDQVRRPLSFRIKSFITGRGSNKYSKHESIYYSINALLSGNAPLFLKVSERDALNIFKSIVNSRNKLFHGSSRNENQITNDMRNLIIILQLVAKALSEIKFDPFLPFEANDV